MAGQGRSIPHASLSCSRCRELKIKCTPRNDHEHGGIRLGCEHCLDNDRHCDWDSRVDRRRFNTRKALTAHIGRLESRLGYQQQQYEDLRRLLNVAVTQTTIRQVLEVDQLSTQLQHRLVLGPNAHLCRYGGSSPFHLRPPTTSNPVPLPPSPPLTSNTANPNIPWSRFLPIEKVPLSEAVHSALLDLFFNCFAFWGRRCNRNRFYRDMLMALPSFNPYNLRHYSPMLHNAILAVATVYSDDPELKRLDVRMAFAKKAEEYINEEIRTPTLSGVQALSLLSTFYTGIGMDIPGSTFFAMCASMTQSLGLGLDASDFVAKIITEQEKHDRECLFWVVFLQDKMEALYLGRDILIPKPHNLRIPELSQEEPQWKATLFKEQINLFLIETDVFQNLYCRAPIKLDEMRTLCDAAWSWYQDLPSPLRSVVDRESIMLHLTFHWVVLILYYPFYRPLRTPFPDADWHQAAVMNCDSAADQIVILFETYPNLLQIPLMAVYVAFSAGVIFVCQMERLATNLCQKEAVFAKFAKCKFFLEQMAHTWDCADNIRMILEDLCYQSPTTLVQPSLPTGLMPVPAQCRRTQGQNLSPSILEDLRNPTTSVQPSLSTGLVPIPAQIRSTQVQNSPLMPTAGVSSPYSANPSGQSGTFQPRSSSGSAGLMVFNPSELYIGQPVFPPSPNHFGHTIPYTRASYHPPPLDAQHWLQNTSVSPYPEMPTTFFPSPSGSGNGAAIRPRFSPAHVSRPGPSTSYAYSAPPMSERGMTRDSLSEWHPIY